LPSGATITVPPAGSLAVVIIRFVGPTWLLTSMSLSSTLTVVGPLSSATETASGTALGLVEGKTVMATWSVSVFAGNGVAPRSLVVIVSVSSCGKALAWYVKVARAAFTLASVPWNETAPVPRPVTFVRPVCVPKFNLPSPTPRLTWTGLFSASASTSVTEIGGAKVRIASSITVWGVVGTVFTGGSLIGVTVMDSVLLSLFAPPDPVLP